MKNIIAIVFVGLLVGCAATIPVDKYNEDLKELSATCDEKIEAAKCPPPTPEELEFEASISKSIDLDVRISPLELIFSDGLGFAVVSLVINDTVREVFAYVILEKRGGIWESVGVTYSSVNVLKAEKTPAKNNGAHSVSF